MRLERVLSLARTIDDARPRRRGRRPAMYVDEDNVRGAQLLLIISETTGERETATHWRGRSFHPGYCHDFCSLISYMVTARLDL